MESYQPTKKEIAIMSRSNAKDRFDFTIRKVGEWEEIFILEKLPIDFAFGLVGEGELIFPIWPAELFAQDNAIGGWSNYQVRKVEIEELLNIVEAQDEQEEEDVLISVFPMGEKAGFIVTIEEFMRDPTLGAPKNTKKNR